MWNNGMKLLIIDNLTGTKVSSQVDSFIHPDITNVVSQPRDTEPASEGTSHCRALGRTLSGVLLPRTESRMIDDTSCVRLLGWVSVGIIGLSKPLWVFFFFLIVNLPQVFIARVGLMRCFIPCHDYDQSFSCVICSNLALMLYSKLEYSIYILWLCQCTVNIIRKSYLPFFHFPFSVCLVGLCREPLLSFQCHNCPNLLSGTSFIL